MKSDVCSRKARRWPRRSTLLTPWQTALVARHPQRPYTLDYVREIFTDFHELHGDRMYADDQSIIGGLARFNGMPCMVIGHQKGRDTANAPRATSACPGPRAIARRCA